ncbi:hypothetical protein ET495_05445 [Xylanimonas allomyrinae]|uniref:Uncharacterized protein n=1 Tax=Xylanimonas allomyrinae TaxID=2509459 RepID=A0A4P6EJS0_9MICO|nr:hypothetical protein [Xylanimonas allomyrinae]QAY62794.1 hypothetical protein ET495_05445 [Xylanimonas allomyrinae]
MGRVADLDLREKDHPVQPFNRRRHPLEIDDADGRPAPVIGAQAIGESVPDPEALLTVAGSQVDPSPALEPIDPADLSLASLNPATVSACDPRLGL